MSCANSCFFNVQAGQEIQALPAILASPAILVSLDPLVKPAPQVSIPKSLQDCRYMQKCSSCAWNKDVHCLSIIPYSVFVAQSISYISGIWAWWGELSVWWLVLIGRWDSYTESEREIVGMVDAASVNDSCSWPAQEGQASQASLATLAILVSLDLLVSIWRKICWNTAS